MLLRAWTKHVIPSYEGRMTQTTAEATFTIQGWDEQPLVEREGSRLTQAAVQQQITGDIEGSSDVRWLMAYTADDRAEFVGVQVVQGSLAGRAGAFVLRSVGTFDGKQAVGDLTVVDGSGSGDLSGITGSGRFVAPMGDTATVTLSYDLG
jgi:hypothetical protein